MPGFLDRDARSGWADSFDNAAAASLYWKQVPVVLRLLDREEHGCDLTVRIFSGTSHGTHAHRVSTAFSLTKPSSSSSSSSSRDSCRAGLCSPRSEAVQSNYRRTWWHTRRRPRFLPGGTTCRAVRALSRFR